VYAQAFFEIGNIPIPAIEPEGFGNFVAGMDMDGDGKPEIVAVNNNQNDVPMALIPRIYKYEWNGLGWDLVWSAVLDVPKQNTWPPLVYGDLDNDGRGEIIWGPVNFLETGNENPARIIVFESRGPGNDAMGVQSGDNSLPNAKWTITDQLNFNLRPFRWILHDIDGDNKKEIIFGDRAASATGYRFGIVSVSDIPNNGGGTETWTLEASGNTSTLAAGQVYDVAALGNTAYLFHAGAAGNVTPVTFAGGNYTIETALPNIVPGGSWKSASVVDINNDGTKEIVVASYSSTNQKVYLLQESLGSLTSTVIADLSTLIGSAAYIYGGAAGDIDRDGKLDFVFGSRDATPSAAIVRLEYAGGDITNSTNYVATLIASGAPAGRWDEIGIANVDGDLDLEVLYSVGYAAIAPIYIIDHSGSTPVELKSFSASVQAKVVTLSWSTATELNNRGFEIERSFNGGNFVTVAFINGRGTTSDPQSYSYIDSDLEMAKYSYRLKQVDFNGTFKYSDVIEVDMNVPVDFVLDQNYPNPFNPNTIIRFGLREDANIKLAVYNLVGEEVALLVNEFRSAGTYQENFNAAGLPSGTYLYRLEANGQSLTNKMIFMK
jgi:hypothetical protein